MTTHTITTTTSIVTYTLPRLRWCGWCGHATRYGTHLPNGDFDYDSVVVPRREIERFKRLADWQNHGRSEEVTRRNIALGYHAGSRP